MKKPLKAPRAPIPSPEPSTFAHALAEIGTKQAELRTRLDAVVAEQIAAEKRGEHINAAAAPQLDRRAAALRLLNGSAEGKVPTPGARRSHKEIMAERAVIEQAIEIAGNLYEQLRLKVRGELTEQRQPALDALMRERTRILLELEHNSQAIAEATRGTNHQPYLFPGLGALNISGSPLHLYFESACRFSWGLDRKTFDAEIARARKAAE